MFSQLWSGSRAAEYRAVRDRRRQKRAFLQGMDSLDERCLLSAYVVIHWNQVIRTFVGVGGAPALVAFPIPVPKPVPSGGVAKAASPRQSHNPGASSSATNGGTGSSSNSLASSTGATVSSITEFVPSFFTTPFTTKAPPAASASRTAQSGLGPFGQSSAPATAQSFGQSLLVSQEQVPQSAHLGQEDDVGDSDATVSAAVEKIQAERFIEIIEKPGAAAPTKASEQPPEPSPAPKLVPIVPDENLESVFDSLDCVLRTTLFEAGSSRPERSPGEPDSSPGSWAMLGAAALSTGALPLAITVPNLSLWRRVARRQQPKLPDIQSPRPF
jgi:hypothetical protein